MLKVINIFKSIKNKINNKYIEGKENWTKEVSGGIKRGLFKIKCYQNVT